MQAPGFVDHDHDRCISASLDVVQAKCDQEGLKLTPARKRVLEYLLAEHRALGAYEVLDMMRKDGIGTQPPAAYRALDFLVAHGFAHKIERLNAFVACSAPDEAHDPAFLICRSCETIAETPSSSDHGDLGTAARKAGFAVEGAVMEAEGLCPKCQDNSPK